MKQAGNPRLTHPIPTCHFPHHMAGQVEERYLEDLVQESGYVIHNGEPHELASPKHSYA